MALLSLIAKLGLDKTGFEAGLNQAGRKVSQFGSGIKSQLAGAFGSAALIAFAKSAVSAAAEIGDVADRLGVSTDAAQQFALAAKMGGNDVQMFAKSFETLRLKQAEAMKEGKAGAFGKLGVSLSMLKQMNPQQLFEALALSIDDIGANTEKAAAIFEIFGAKMGGKVISMLQDLEKAQKSAAILSPADIKAAQAFDDGWQIAIQNAKASLVAFYSDVTGGHKRLLKAQKFTGPMAFLLGSIFGESNEEAQGREIEADAATAKMEKMLQQKQKERAEVEAVDALVARIADVEEKNRLAGLTKEERLTEEKQKQLELAAKVAEMSEKGTGTNAERAAALLALREQEGIVQALAQGIKPDAVKRTDDKALFRASTDSLGRIGGGIGPGKSGIESELNKHTRELQKLNRRIERGVRIEEFR